MQPTALRRSTISTGGGKHVWSLHEYDTVSSTNDIARDLPPWSAVRADVQTKGRGRYGRHFISGIGGVWLSAVLPATGNPSDWTGFSLQVGASILDQLRAMGAPGARLRWPNDLMIGHRKVAGILIEQPATGVLITGVGINVLNEPWRDHPELRHTSTNLSEYFPSPTIGKVVIMLLEALSEAHATMRCTGIKTAIEKLNLHWKPPRPVEVSLNSGEIKLGLFEGLDAVGNLLIRNTRSGVETIEHQNVTRLLESDSMVSQTRSEC